MKRPRSILWLVAGLSVVSGCARYPEGPGDGVDAPDRVVAFRMTVKGRINPLYYYFFAVDTDQDQGRDGPVAVVAGPFWGNGWGTGSISRYLEYHIAAPPTLWATVATSTLVTAGGGILNATGSPTDAALGQHVLTVETVSLGTATLSGSGTIAGVTNNSDQNAGTFSIQTDASGATVAGGVSFTPAPDGSRPLTTEESSRLTALNAGGVALAADSLDVFGLTLQIAPVPSAGTQTIAIGPTTAQVRDVFTADVTGIQSIAAGTVTANSTTPTATPPIPGVTLSTGTLVTGGSATVRTMLSPNNTLVADQPFAWTDPAGSNTWQATIDVADLGSGLREVSFNFITTTELIFDPQYTGDKPFDALGPRGNDYVTVRLDADDVFTNQDALTPEREGDVAVADIDITDWRVEVRRP
jgi:hypothetical protein